MTSIVLEVCRQCKVHPIEFFGRKRDKRLVRCRRIAIAQLQQAGFNNMAVARLMRRSYSNIQYWTHKKYRMKRRKYCRDYMAERMAA